LLFSILFIVSKMSKSTKVVLRPYTLYPIPYTLHPKKDPNLSLFRRSAYIKCHVKILRVHVMCALFRIAAPMGTSGLRAGSPSRANGHIPRAPAAARCVHVLPAFSTQILNYLHHPSVPDQYASNIREQLYVRSGLSVTRLLRCPLVRRNTLRVRPVRAHCAESSDTASVGRTQHILDK
jgi:hypothetical protein